MATQTLETIPEETVAPATTPARVTSEVPKTKPATAKNPGRVASGKRLAERHHLAREAKRKKNKPKHRNQPQTQLQMQQAPPQIRQNNQATATQPLVTLFLGLVG